MLAVEGEELELEIRYSFPGVGYGRKELPEAGTLPDKTSASESENLQRMQGVNAAPKIPASGHRGGMTERPFIGADPHLCSTWSPAVFLQAHCTEHTKHFAPQHSGRSQGAQLKHN